MFLDPLGTKQKGKVTQKIIIITVQGGDIVTLMWFGESVCASRFDLVSTIKTLTVACIFVKLGRQINHDKRINPTDFRVSEVKGKGHGQMFGCAGIKRLALPLFNQVSCIYYRCHTWFRTILSVWISTDRPYKLQIWRNGQENSKSTATFMGKLS